MKHSLHFTSDLFGVPKHRLQAVCHYLSLKGVSDEIKMEQIESEKITYREMEAIKYMFGV